MVEGYMADVKAAIIAHVIASDASLTATNVLGSWNEDIWTLDYDNLPIVTVRIGPAIDQEVVHGREVGGGTRATFVAFFFTLHLFHTTPSSGDKSTTAMNLADVIKTYLLKADDSASGIRYYRDITMRESKINIHNVARVILEGYVFVRRPIT